MPIRRRRESSTGIYHVIVKGINNERIFNQQREKIYLKKIILKHLEVFEVEVYSYCIMSNHAHFIIRAEIQVLSSFMAIVLSEYANYYNFKHHRNGHVFQNRFKSECIENEKYFWMCLRYIHLNPVKAGMVKKATRYKYSSMGEYLVDEPIIIHEKALAMSKKSFLDFDAFEKFHNERETEVFEDVADEKLLQEKKIALEIAEEMMSENNLALLMQVFEEKAIRNEYIKKIKQNLKLSQRRAKELSDLIRNEVENK